MPDFVVRGKVASSSGNPVAGIFVQAVDSDQELYEDRNDDITGIAMTKSDGSFEIPFDRKDFQDGWLEGNPDLYLAIRNKSGQVIHKTGIRRGVKPGDASALTFNVVIDSLEKTVEPDPDPYDQNNSRVIASFADMGDAVEFRAEDVARNLALFTSSINAWTRYTREDAWKRIGYDGPQVPRYPWKQNHSHKLSWEGPQ
jgi:hypothetical protein